MSTPAVHGAEQDVNPEGMVARTLAPLTQFIKDPRYEHYRYASLWTFVLIAATTCTLAVCISFKNDSHVDDPIRYALISGFSDTGSSPAPVQLKLPVGENTPQTLIARLSWGRSGMLYALTSIVCLCILRSLAQQLTTIAVVIAPFLTGSATIELLGTLG